jgi:hypothetical protein
MPPWGCDREQGGSAPNAVKRYKRKELAETAGYFGEPLILPSCNSLEGRQLLTFLNLNPIFALLNGRPATAYRSSKYLLTVCARQFASSHRIGHARRKRRNSAALAGNDYPRR